MAGRRLLEPRRKLLRLHRRHTHALQKLADRLHVGQAAGAGGGGRGWGINQTKSFANYWNEVFLSPCHVIIPIPIFKYRELVVLTQPYSCCSMCSDGEGYLQVITPIPHPNLQSYPDNYLNGQLCQMHHVLLV